MKIENEEQLAEAKRDLEAFERHGLTKCMWEGLSGLSNKIEKAIAEYENRTDLARIAVGLSEKAKARLAYLTTYADIHSKSARNETEEKGLEDKGRAIATPLGLAVLAELQSKPPKRWGVFVGNSKEPLCVTDTDEKGKEILNALLLSKMANYVTVSLLPNEL